METNTLIDKIQLRLDYYVKNEELSNEDLVQIIEQCGAYLNLRSIAKYAKDEGISYNGVKNNRCIRKIFGNKYVIDNY